MKTSGIRYNNQCKKISFKQNKKKDSSFKGYNRAHHTHKKNKLEQAPLTQLNDLNSKVATAEESLNLLKRMLKCIEPVLCSLGEGLSILTENARVHKKFNQEELYYLGIFSQKLDSINYDISKAERQFSTLKSQLAPLKDKLLCVTNTISKVAEKKQQKSIFDSANSY